MKLKASKERICAVVRRSGRNAAKPGKNETLTTEVTDVSGKRKRKPNLRYVDGESVRSESKESNSLGNEVTETSKTPKFDGTDTTGTDKKSKKNRKRKNVQYEVNCSDIKELDIKAFVRNLLFVDFAQRLLFFLISFYFSKPTCSRK